jgi:hypothetical protein
MPDLESIAPESRKHHVEDQGISKCDSPGVVSVASVPMSVYEAEAAEYRRHQALKTSQVAP